MLRWPRCNGKEERVKKGCVSVRCWSILSKAPCVSWEEVLSQHSLPSQWRSAVSHNSRCFTLYATAGSKKKASKSGDAAVAAAGPTPLELSLRLEVILSLRVEQCCCGGCGEPACHTPCTLPPGFCLCASTESCSKCWADLACLLSPHIHSLLLFSALVGTAREGHLSRKA